MTDTAVVIKAAEAQRRALQALNLRDVENDAEQLLAQARREAEAIVADAHRDAGTLREQARSAGREEGFAAGREQGLAEGRAAGEAQGRQEGALKAAEEFGALNTPAAEMLAAALKLLDQKRLALLDEAQQDLLRLAVAIGEKLARRSFDFDPSRIAAQVRAAIDLVAERSAIDLFVNDADLQCVRELLGDITRGYLDLKQVRVHADPAMGRGDVRVTTSRGKVEIGLDRCAQEIARTLLADE